MRLLLHNANILLRVKHPGVTCKPVSMCLVVYGTNPQHFLDFGFVSPEENSCHSTSNLVLCVQPPAVTSAPVTRPPVVTVPIAVTQAPKPVIVTQAPVTPGPNNLVQTVQTPQFVPVLPTGPGFPTFGQGVSGQPPYPYYHNVQVCPFTLRVYS